MYCQKCGTELSGQALFCPQCGTKVTGQGAREADSETSSKLFPSITPKSNDDISQYYELVIGPSNTDYYLSKFKAFDSGGSKVSWNWPSFFVTLYWMLYRKMWGWAAAYYFLPTILMVFSWAASPEVGSVVYLLILIGTFAFFPMFANGIYHGHCRKKIQKIVRNSSTSEIAKATIAAKGGTSGVALFIAIILISIFCLGILAAIALPAYQDYTIRAKVSEALAVGAQYKTAVSDYVATTGKWPQSEFDLDVDHNRAWQIVNDVSLENNGLLVIHLKGDPQLEGRSFSLRPEVVDGYSLSWHCENIDLKPNYLPANCRD